jgi:hypothetical protein
MYKHALRLALPLKWHQQAQQLRRELSLEGHIEHGQSCFNCGLALASLGVRLLRMLM